MCEASISVNGMYVWFYISIMFIAIIKKYEKVHLFKIYKVNIFGVRISLF